MPGSTAARGYTGAHVTERRRWAKLLASAGALPCAEPRPGCPGVVLAGSPWDLAHDHVNGGWKGVAHRRCNRGEGGRRGALKVNARRGRRRPRVPGGVFGPLSS